LKVPYMINKWGKLTVILALITLCCFVFAGAALATPSNFDIYVPGGNPETGEDTNIVKASYTYDYWLNLKLDPSIDVIALGNKPIDIVFPDGFDLSPAEGQTVQLVVTVCEDTYQEDQLMQIVPEISGQTATFVIQRQNLPESGEVRNISIQGLSVTNPCVADSYCVEVHNSCFDFNCLALKVVETVGSIEITTPLTITNVKGGTSVTVTGEVWDACGNPWPYDTWPVIIDIVDLKGRPAMDGGDCVAGLDGDVICPVITHTVMGDDATTFTATIKVPAQGYDYEGGTSYDYLVRARTVEVKDIVGGDPKIEFEEGFGLNSEEMIPATDLWSLKEELDWKGEDKFWDWENVRCGGIFWGEDHSWIAADPQQVYSIPGVLTDITIDASGQHIAKDGSSFILNKPVNVTICGLDKFCRKTDASGLKIDLLAYQNYIQASESVDLTSQSGYVAGLFFDGAGNQISHVYVPNGSNCVTVNFVPLVSGQIYLEARSIIGGVAKNDTTDINVVNEVDVELEVTPLVLDGSDPRAGWPLKASVWLMDANGKPIAASEDWEVKVGLLSDFRPVTFLKSVTWDTNLNVCYNAKGTKRGYADYLPDESDFGCWDETCFIDWDSYIHPYCTEKSHFYVYPPSSANGKHLIVVVGVFSKATGELLGYDKEEFDLTTPVELVRKLDSETWQTFSTPKWLANGSDCSKYGTFKDLLKVKDTAFGAKDYVWDSETLIMSYQNGAWRVLSANDVVEPLQCYYIRTRQPLAPADRDDYWTAQYVFDRATSPSEMVPPTRELTKGWNSVGLAVSPNVLDNEYQSADFLYHGLGSICDCCKLVWNPGNSVGNLACWTVAAINSGTLPAWAADPLYLSFNGDNYWMFVDCDDAILAGNIGLDLVDP